LSRRNSTSVVNGLAPDHFLRPWQADSVMAVSSAIEWSGFARRRSRLYETNEKRVHRQIAPRNLLNSIPIAQDADRRMTRHMAANTESNGFLRSISANSDRYKRDEVVVVRA